MGTSGSGRARIPRPRTIGRDSGLRPPCSCRRRLCHHPAARTEESRLAWRSLGDPEPEELLDARLQAHYAAQIVCAVGLTFLEPRPDDSHPNFGWDDGLSALVGHPAEGADGFRAALRLADLTLLLLDGSGRRASELALPGRTLEEGHVWLAGAIEARLGRRLERELVRSTYEIPPHAVATGASFRASPALAELARWFESADFLLESLAAGHRGAAPVRCWPHHFDLGTILPHGSAARAGTIGLGLSPGDESYAEPYWYVTPDPHPELPRLPDLAGAGLWHTEGWLGAVLPGTRQVAAGDAAAQERRAREFLDAAIRACAALVDAAAD